ncbi:MAG: flagellar basal body P-ring formation chaperone FlgA [Candidatus Margulisiibacteriota bacterium]
MIKIQDTRYKQISKLNIGICLLVIVWLLFLGNWDLPAEALDNPEAKLADVVEDYVLTAHPDWIGLDMRVTFKFADKIFASLKNINDKAEFKIVDVYKDFRPVGNVIFPIKITGDSINRKVFVRAKVEVFKPVVVSAKKIKRGETIVEEDVAVEERDIAMLPEKYFKDQIMVIGTEAKTTIPKNSTIFSWMVKEVPLVHRGDNVAILVKGENLLIKTEGAVLMDGYLGKEVKVKRKDSKKSVEGILISSDEVEVTLK